MSIRVHIQNVKCSPYHLLSCRTNLTKYLFCSCRTGCKPFVEVFQNGERVYTSATHDTMERIPSFTAESGGVLVALGAKVRGNIQVIVHHIRAIPLARKANMVRECSP